MEIFTLSIYLLLFLTWGHVGYFALRHIETYRHGSRLIFALLMILLVDAVRTMIESGYFGLNFGSLFGYLPVEISELLQRPEYLIIPKLFNLLAVLIIIFIILRKWFPEHMREVTDQKKRHTHLQSLNRELIDSQERYQAILDNMYDSVAIYEAIDEGRDFRFIKLNKAALQLEGLMAEQVEGKRLMTLFPVVEEIGVLDFFRSVYQTNIPARKMIIIEDESGKKSYRDNYAYTLPSGELVVVYQNVTEEVIAKNHLEVSQRYTKALLDAQENIILVSDGEETFDINHFGLEFFGHETLEEFREAHSCICEYFEKVDLPGYIYDPIDGIRWLDYILLHSEEQHKVNIITDENHIFSITVQPFHAKDIRHYIISLHDITELERRHLILEKAASIDGLTQVANRTSFDTLLENYVSAAKRYQNDFALLFFDIDHFKEVNDTYGHQVGDKVLISLTTLVREHLRKSDTLARWGGEEFTVILPELTLSMAYEVAEKLRIIIEESSFESVEKVTCSFGVTQFFEGDSSESMMLRVDKALYLAKTQGRDQTVTMDKKMFDPGPDV